MRATGLDFLVLFDQVERHNVSEKQRHPDRTCPDQSVRIVGAKRTSKLIKYSAET